MLFAPGRRVVHASEGMPAHATDAGHYVRKIIGDREATMQVTLAIL